jgi:hypothetical protein
VRSNFGGRGELRKQGNFALELDYTKNLVVV